MSWGRRHMGQTGAPGGFSMSWGQPHVPYGGTRGVFHVLGATPYPIWGHMGGPPCPGDALMSHMGAHGGSSKTWGCPDVPYGDTGGVFHVLGAAPCPIWGHQEGLPCPGGNPMSHMGTPGGSSVSWGCPDVPYGNTGRVSHVLGATSYRDREGHMGGPPCLRNIPTPHMGAHGGSSMPQGPPDVPTSHMGYTGGPPRAHPDVPLGQCGAVGTRGPAHVGADWASAPPRPQ